MSTATDVQNARQTIAQSRTALSALSRSHADAQGTARTSAKDPNLSTGGKAQAQRDALASAQSQAQRSLDGIRSSLSDASDTLQAAAVDPTPTTDQLAQQQAHWRRAETLLNAGQHPAIVIANTTDPAALQALRAELPTYLTAQAIQSAGAKDARSLEALGGSTPTAPDHSAIMLHLDKQIAAHGSGPASTAATARLALATEHHVASVHADGVGAEVHGVGSRMRTAIAVRTAEAQAAAIHGTPDTTTATQPNNN